MSTSIPPLSFEDFGDWLAAQSPFTQFERRHCTRCAVAQFVRSKTGGLVTVTYYSVWLEKNAREIREDLPAWAREFIKDIDSSGTGEPVDVSHCIQALSRVTAPIFPKKDE